MYTPESLRETVRCCMRCVVAACVLFSCINCAGVKPGKGFVEDTPDEIQKLVKREYAEAVWAVGSATGPDEGAATRQAAMQARAEIAREFRSQIDVLQKSYEESINNQAVAEFQQVTEVFASLELSGSKIAKSMVRKEKDGEYLAKALVVVSAEQLKAIVDEKMQAYTSFKASKAYRDLEERVAREREHAGAAVE